jgi:Xaa-Pro aminopeptidase
VEAWKRALDKARVALVEDAGGTNLVDAVWGGDRPRPSLVPVQPLGVRFSGATSAHKLEQLRSAMRKKGVQVAVVSALDEVAWLLNLRGADIEYNPLFMSFVVVTEGGETTLCAEPAQLASDVTRAHLDKARVQVQPYDSVGAVLREIAGAAGAADNDEEGKKARQRPETRVWLDPTTCNWDVYRTVQRLGMVPVRDAPLSIQLAKSLKNPTELDGMRACHVRDGAALCSHFAWLEAQLVRGSGGSSSSSSSSRGRGLDEVTVADHLEARRARETHFVGLSFETISSSGPNGAVIHYAPTRGACSAVTADELYLCDSGAQYLDGTTDVTRTIHFGTPTAHERRCFTRVLQGHIGLATARFPAGTEGHKLDILARMPLFSDGLDYGHGTGHGVGAYGCVHEGPQGIGIRRRRYEGGLQEGMTMTIEPGYYEDGNFGIRIENVYIVVRKDTPHRHGGQAFLGFENITWAPIQTKMVAAELLSPQELAWLNGYNARCRKVLLPLLEADEPEAAAWVVRETEPLAAAAAGAAVPKL